MTDNNGAIQVREPQEPSAMVLSMKQISDRVNMVHQVLEKVMQKGTHYGTVPGCGPKMVLLKPGADVLAMTFRLVPRFDVNRTDLENGHREYDVTCTMSGPDGAVLGQGVGSASSMEKKYRYRKDANGNKIENEDIADCYNTVLKIAKKRAHIDATLTVTGAADLFTQDLIDEDGESDAKTPVAMPVEKAAKPVQQELGCEIVTVTIGEIKSKSGGTAEKPWTRYFFKAGDDWYSTFDTKIADQLRPLTGSDADLRIERTDKGITILGVVSDAQE